VKVREGLSPGDYGDPGWYRHPAGTVAYEVPNGAVGAPARRGDTRKGGAELRAVKPKRSHDSRH
jgi:hypothetical protein